ncbi:FliA/WhiG family RNA polymerase sigma factor [Thermosulfuriphilus sp.]
MKKTAATEKDNRERFKLGKVDKKTRDELIIEYAPLIKYIAGKLALKLPPNVSVDDLISAGVMGLIDAINKFDPSKNIQFKTYAEFRIRGAMLDELRSLDWVPRSIRKKTAELEKAYAKLEKELGRPAEDEEVAKELGLSLDEFYRLLEETKGATFIDIETIRRKMPDLNEEDIFDLIADPDQEDPFDSIQFGELKDVLAQAIESLPEKERLVVALYYYEDLTMREIGEIMGYTESRISQLHTKAMMRLKAHLSEILDPDDLQ